MGLIIICKKCDRMLPENAFGLCKTCYNKKLVEQEIEKKFNKLQFKKIIVDFTDKRDLLVALLKLAEAECKNTHEMILTILSQHLVEKPNVKQ